MLNEGVMKYNSIRACLSYTCRNRYNDLTITRKNFHEKASKFSLKSVNKKK